MDTVEEWIMEGISPKINPVERYRTVLNYLAYENTMFWQRGNFFLVASSALIGLVTVSMIRTEIGGALMTLVMSVAGGVLIFFWLRGLRAGEFWIYHWHTILKKLEGAAFGELCLLRDFKPDKNYPTFVRARPLAYGPPIVFAILWFLIVLYGLYKAVCAM